MTEEPIPFISKIFKNNNSLQITIPMKQVVRILKLKPGDYVRISDIKKIIIKEDKK